MPPARLLPDENSVLEREIRELGQAAVAAKYNVTRQAVSIAVRDRKLNVPARMSYKDYIPWKVRGVHQHAYPQVMLRFWARQQMGLNIPAEAAGRLDAFKAELKRLNVVVSYDPDRGWFYCAPRPGVDTGLIRVPDPE